MSKYLCIDIGGTAIKYGVLNDKYSVLSKGEINTPQYESEFLTCIEGIYNEQRNKNIELNGIAISTTGKVNDNIIITGGNVPYIASNSIGSTDTIDSHYWISKLRQYSSLPVTVENDGICAALAELHSGVLKNCKDAITVVFGTGIAGGIILDGKVRRGFNNACGEFSFIIMGAGFYNDETLWSADIGDFHLRKLVSEIKNIQIEKLDGRKIFEMANSGDREVKIVIENYTRLIARNLFNLQAVLDVEKIAIGGGISSQKLFIDGIISGIQNYASMIDSPVEIPKIVRCKYTSDANLVGALVKHLH